MSRKLQKLLEIVLRDRIILNVINFRARKNRINLHWAPVIENNSFGLCMAKKTDVQNLGDYLAIPIYEYMLAKFGLDKDKRTTGTKHLYTIGSILLIGHQDATIWGSGILMREPEGMIWGRNRYRKLDVRCVRGELTKKRLEENGYDVSRCKLGDPGVLMPLVYKPSVEQSRDFGVMVHMSKLNDEEHKAEYEEYKDNLIDILTDDYKKTIDEICSCKLIISSTLHGIILAESYGIPAILLRRYQFDDFKYRDYYSATGRKLEDIASADSVEEALKMAVPKVPDVSGLQKNLLESFPVDLWD